MEAGRAVKLELWKEKWGGKIEVATIGAAEAEGGSRDRVVRVGGETTLPFLTFEGEMPHPPLVVGEILDAAPTDWPEPLTEAFGDVLTDPVAWGKKWVEEFGAEALLLRLASTDPESQDASPEAAAACVRRLLEAVKVPLLLWGCEDVEKDNLVFPKVSEAASGERCFIGPVTKDNYKSIAAAAQLSGHGLIAQSPVDVNIQKQTNILLLEFGIKKDKILMDPTTGGLGYGMEYTYSVMERLRLGALQGETQVAMPLIVFPGAEAWKTKEAKESEADYPQWGSREKRAILWEVITATTLLQGGADVLVVRHPETAAVLREHIRQMLD